VRCSEPVTRTPLSGWEAAYLRRIDIRPGISCSAMSISLRPKSVREMSATLYGAVAEEVCATAFIACSGGEGEIPSGPGAVVAVERVEPGQGRPCWAAADASARFLVAAPLDGAGALYRCIRIGA